MVFVSMSPVDLLPRTAKYQMREPSPLSESENLEPLYLEDLNESRPPSRRRGSSVQRTIPPPLSNLSTRAYRYNTTRSLGNSAQACPPIESRSDTSPRHEPSALAGPSDFTVTTSCNDPSSDEEEASSAATLADRLRRDSLPPPYEPSSDEDTEVGLERAMRRARAMRVPSSHDYYRRSRRRAEPGKIEIVGAADGGGDVGENEGVLSPHARFFIESTRRYVISHECYHIQRQDSILKMSSDWPRSFTLVRDNADSSDSTAWLV